MTKTVSGWRIHHERSVWRAGFSSILLILGGCGDEGTALTSEPVSTPKPVQVEVVSNRRYDSFIHVPGLVEAKSSMSLSFRVAGTIESFAIEEGEFVEQGGVIAELDRRDYVRAVKLAQASLTSADAQAADAKREFERQERLRKANSSSVARLDTARSAHHVAEAEAHQARLELEASEVALKDCILTAPVSGHVERRLLEKHEFAAPEVAVVVLTELASVKVRANVADRVLSTLTVGGAALIRSNAWPDRVFAGRIARVAMAADSITHTMPIEIEVANQDLALRPAMVVEVSLQAENSSELLTVPMNAVVRDSALRTLCFVVVSGEDETRAEIRLVSLGRLTGDRVEITSGLRPGERVIVSGQHFLRAGDGVRIVRGEESAPDSSGVLEAGI